MTINKCPKCSRKLTIFPSSGRKFCNSCKWLEKKEDRNKFTQKNDNSLLKSSQVNNLQKFLTIIIIIIMAVVFNKVLKYIFQNFDNAILSNNNAQKLSSIKEKVQSSSEEEKFKSDKKELIQLLQSEDISLSDQTINEPLKNTPNKLASAEENHNLVESLNKQAKLYYSQGKYNQAEPLYLQLLELNKELLGEEHPNIAIILNNLAVTYKAQGKYEQVEPLYLQALELNKTLLGEEHYQTSINLNNLAEFYYSQKRYSEAEHYFLKALELKQKILGEEHPSTAKSLNNLAGLYESQGRYKEAKNLYRQALKIAEQALGKNHPYTIIIRKNYKR